MPELRSLPRANGRALLDAWVLGPGRSIDARDICEFLGKRLLGGDTLETSQRTLNVFATYSQDGREPMLASITPLGARLERLYFDGPSEADWAAFAVIGNQFASRQRYNNSVRLRSTLAHPVTITAAVLAAFFVAIELREPHFEPVWAILFGYAATLELPCAAWANAVSRDLALSAPGRLFVLAVAWSLPVAIYGVVAGPAWMVIGATDGDLPFAAKGACLLFATLALPFAYFIHRRWRKAVPAG